MTAIVTQRVRANGLDFTVDIAGDGDTVALLLHGFPECRGTWMHQLPVLPGLGWKVAAPDLRGYGQTTRPNDRAAYRIEHLVEDVRALSDALGAKRRILIGHDWGGVIAWQAALRGVPLDGLVILNAPHPAVFSRVLNDGWKQKLRSWYVLFFQLPGLPERMLTRGGGDGIVRLLKGMSDEYPDALAEQCRRNVLEPGAATAMINYYRANMTALGSAPPVTSKLTVPTLMLWGEDDVALDVALTEGNEDFIDDFTLHRLPGVTHWSPHEAADEVNAGIADWARARGLA